MERRKTYISPRVEDSIAAAPSLLNVSRSKGPGAGDIDPPDVDDHDSGIDDDTSSAKPFSTDYGLWDDNGDW